MMAFQRKIEMVKGLVIAPDGMYLWKLFTSLHATISHILGLTNNRMDSKATRCMLQGRDHLMAFTGPNKIHSKSSKARRKGIARLDQNNCHLTQYLVFNGNQYQIHQRKVCNPLTSSYRVISHRGSFFLNTGRLG